MKEIVRLKRELKSLKDTQRLLRERWLYLDMKILAFSNLLKNLEESDLLQK